MPRSFRLWVAAFLLLGLAGHDLAALAQSADADYGTDALTSRRQPVRIVAEPTYQYFDDNGTQITQWSLPIRATVPLLERLQLSLRANVASADVTAPAGAPIAGRPASVAGLGDVQASLSYVREVGEGSVIVSAGANVPTGKQELTLEEFTTVTFLSQNFYEFRVPGFGQGPGLATGVTWAVPIRRNVVLGVGGSFRLQGGYTPVERMGEEYTPGSEVLVTTGLDYQLSPTSALSADVAVTLYGTDTLGDVDQFEAGTKVAGTLQYVRSRGFSRLQVVARYENRGRSTLPAVGGSVAGAQTEELQILPTQGALRARYDTRLAERWRLGVFAAGRWYDETALFESKTVATGGVEPRLGLGGGVTLAPRAAYTAGDFTGVEAGLGIIFQQ